MCRHIRPSCQGRCRAQASTSISCNMQCKGFMKESLHSSLADDKCSMELLQLRNFVIFYTGHESLKRPSRAERNYEDLSDIHVEGEARAAKRSELFQNRIYVYVYIYI